MPETPSPSATPPAPAAPGSRPHLVALARLSPDLREPVLAVAREGTLVEVRDPGPLPSLGLALLGTLLLGAVAFVVLQPPFDERRVHGALAAGAVLALATASLGLVALGIRGLARRIRSPLRPSVATVPGLAVVSWGEGRALVFPGSALASPPSRAPAKRWCRLVLDVAGRACELRVREGPVLEQALIELGLAPESAALELPARLEREGAGALLDWPPPPSRTGRRLALASLAVLGLGALAFVAWRASGAQHLDAVTRQLEDEARADMARLAAAPRPPLDSLAALAPPADEDAAPLYLALAHDLAALHTEQWDELDLWTTPPESAEPRPELERRRAFVERAVRAAVASRCDFGPRAGEALAASRDELEIVPALLGAAAYDAVLRGGRPLDGAALALASLRAVADLEPLGVAASARRPALAALDFAASQCFSGDLIFGETATRIETLAGDIAAIESSFPDAATEARRSTRTSARQIARAAGRGGCPADICVAVGVTLPGVNLALWRWFPVEGWAAGGLERLHDAGERVAAACAEPDPVVRRQGWDEQRRAASPMTLLEVLDPLGRRRGVWERVAPQPSGRAEDLLARLRLARAAAQVAVGSRYTIEAKGDLPPDPLRPWKSVRIEGCTSGFAVVAGLAQEDAGDDSGHVERGTVLKGGVLENDQVAYPGLGEIAILCDLPRAPKSSVEVGLEWLLRHHDKNWLRTGSPCPDHGSQGLPETGAPSRRATALAALALLGAGHAPMDPREAKPGHPGAGRIYDRHDLRVHSLSAQLQFALWGLERVDFDLSRGTSPGATPLDEDAIDGLALAHAFSATDRVYWRGAAQGSLERLAARLARGDGRGAARRERETAAWVALALATARAARIPFPPTAWESLRTWATALETATPDDALALVPAAILAFAEGTATDESRARREKILAALEKGEPPSGEVAALEIAALGIDVYGPEGRATAKRLEKLRTALCHRQAIRKDGCADGSFPPLEGSDRGCETAATLLALEGAYGYASWFGARLRPK